jgi:dihydrofolate reductase
MRKLRIFEHISLDGVIQHSADGGDFPYEDWPAPYRGQGGREALLAAQGAGFDLLLGRRTYDMWSGYWPEAPSSPMADALNCATKFVATHRPEGLGWGPAEAVGPDLIEGVRRIKREGSRSLILWGSSSLTSALMEHGLVDEIVLIVYPVFLGTGKRLLAQGTPAQVLELISSQAFSSGTMLNLYRVAGALKQA